MQLEVGNLLFEQVLFGAQLEGLDQLGERLDFLFVSIKLLSLFPEFFLLELLDFGLPSFDLHHIFRILLLDFHENPPHLNSFIEILKDMLLYSLDLLPLLDSTTVAHVPLLPHIVVPCVYR